jgi:putative tryptophan/tyrosine transport system substrate-binding protein
VVALLVNPNNASNERMMKLVQEAGPPKKVQVRVLKAGTESDIDIAFASLIQLHADALLVGPDPFLFSRREQLVALTARHALPAIYEWREFAEAGGLISCGTNLADMYRQAGIYAGRSSRAPSRPICLSSNRPNSSWSSISRPPTRSA